MINLAENFCSHAVDVFGGDLFCVVFSHRVSQVGSGIQVCQFLKIFLLTYL